MQQILHAYTVTVTKRSRVQVIGCKSEAQSLEILDRAFGLGYHATIVGGWPQGPGMSPERWLEESYAEQNAIVNEKE